MKPLCVFLILIAVMGPGGLAALGQIVDLHMTWGVYEFGEQDTIIRGEGSAPRGNLASLGAVAARAAGKGAAA